MKAALVWGVTLSTLAFGEIRPPRVGLAVDAQANWRVIYGVAGNFVCGEAVRPGIAQAGFAGSLGYVVDQGAVVLLDGSGNEATRWTVQSANPRVALSSDGRAAIWDDLQLVLRQDGAWQPMAFDAAALGGDLIGLAVTADGVRFAVQRGDSRWIVATSGDVARIADGQGPVFLLDDGTAVAAVDSVSNDGGLVIRRADGKEERIATATAIASMAALGRGWLQLRDATGVSLGLAVETGRIYYLPDSCIVVQEGEEQE